MAEWLLMGYFASLNIPICYQREILKTVYVELLPAIVIKTVFIGL